MLQRLYIKNYVLIKEIEIVFSNHLSVITGETGAGKSILLDALGMLLGERADYKSVLNIEEKCIVEADFDISNNELVKEWLGHHNLDYTDSVTLRREIQPQTNKSRAFIHDTPVTLQQMEMLSSFLIDVHRQFDSMQIFQKSFQMNMLDALAGTQLSVSQYAKQYFLWKEKSRALETLKQTSAQQKTELEYLQFVYDELEKAHFKPDEIETLEIDLKQLENAEKIQGIIFQGKMILNDHENNILVQLTQWSNQLENIKTLFPALHPLHERVKATKIELQDIYDELVHAQDKIKYNPTQIEALHNRVSLGFQLLKKHKVQTTNELIGLKDEFAQQLETIVNADNEINVLEKEVLQLYDKMMLLGQQLSKHRSSKKVYFEKSINAMFKDVGMPNAVIQLQMKTQSPNEYGIDDVEILFDSNGTGKFETIKKVASGGELSRLALCLKFLIADYMTLPTMVFDEIDSGISGEVCKKVGHILKILSSTKQIICVTHQPQIAAKGMEHFYVYKEIADHHTLHTHIKKLNQQERIKAIAEMLSGATLTHTALQHAQEMMAQN